jgi:hypothetical protein
MKALNSRRRLRAIVLLNYTGLHWIQDRKNGILRRAAANIGEGQVGMFRICPWLPAARYLKQTNGSIH